MWSFWASGASYMWSSCICGASGAYIHVELLHNNIMWSLWTCGDMKRFWTCGDMKSLWTSDDMKSLWTCGDVKSLLTCGDVKSLWTSGDVKSLWTSGAYIQIDFIETQLHII